MKKRIIFDQDNTLVTWTDDSYNTLDTTFKKLEIPLTKEDKEIIIEAISKRFVNMRTIMIRIQKQI